METQVITLKPERLAELEKYAQRHGQTPADALDDLLAAQLEWERKDHEETVAAVLEANNDIESGCTVAADEVLNELRTKYGFSG